MRVLIKLSGEALGENGILFDFERINRVAEAIAELHRAHFEIAVVIGGGNIWRGRRGPAACMDAVTADQMGMLGTVINSLAMRDALERQGVPACVQSAVEMSRFAEPHMPHRAVKLLKEGTVVLFAAGTGDPFHSTDTSAAQRAAEISADALLMAKNIDGIYDKDPRQNPDAQRYSNLTYDEALSMRQGAVDQGALQLLKEVKFPKLYVFELKTPQNIIRAANGENLGTLLHP